MNCARTARFWNIVNYYVLNVPLSNNILLEIIPQVGIMNWTGKYTMYDSKNLFVHMKKVMLSANKMKLPVGLD